MTASSFDHIARDFTAARGLPPHVTEQIVDSLVGALPPGARVADIGAGTGRIARPLLARGVNVISLDLSLPMLQQLAAPSARIVADAARLPVLSGSLDAAYSVHVFQLIAHWRAALVEIRRALKPAGAFLSGYEWRPPDSPGAAILAHWREIIRAQGFPNDEPGARDLDDVKAALLEMGAQMQEWSVGEWTMTRTLARHIESIEHRTWSNTWQTPPGFFGRCLAELRAWAIERYGPLETEFTVPHRFVWQKFQWRLSIMGA
jgi:ubiquinone/menaquinone biosynthesis C-methylase UbiE